MSAITGIPDLRAIVGQGVGVVLAGHGDAHDLAARCGQLGDLLQRGVDVGGHRGGHRLDADRCIAADRDRVGRVLEQDLAGGPPGREDGRRKRGHAQVDAHGVKYPAPRADDAHAGSGGCAGSSGLPDHTSSAANRTRATRSGIHWPSAAPPARGHAHAPATSAIRTSTTRLRQVGHCGCQRGEDHDDQAGATCGAGVVPVSITSPGPYDPAAAPSSPASIPAEDTQQEQQDQVAHSTAAQTGGGWSSSTTSRAAVRPGVRRSRPRNYRVGISVRGSRRAPSCPPTTPPDDQEKTARRVHVAVACVSGRADAVAIGMIASRLFSSRWPAAGRGPARPRAPHHLVPPPTPNSPG